MPMELVLLALVCGVVSSTWLPDPGLGLGLGVRPQPVILPRGQTGHWNPRRRPHQHSIIRDLSPAAQNQPLPLTSVPASEHHGQRAYRADRNFVIRYTQSQPLSTTSTTTTPASITTPTIRGPPLPTATTTLPPQTTPRDDSGDIHHELQVQLSQQIQMQLEQLQRLHELQQKMLAAPRPRDDPIASPSPSMSSNTSTEQINRRSVLHHGLPSPPQSAPQPEPQPRLTDSAYRLPPLFPGELDDARLSVDPSPPPPPDDRPRYPEEMEPLQSFIRGGVVARSSVNSGFLPIADQHLAADPTERTELLDDFLPFIENATDPALPYYLVPPALESDSQFQTDLIGDSLRTHSGPLEDPGPSASDTFHVPLPRSKLNRPKKRLRPPR